MKFTGVSKSYGDKAVYRDFSAEFSGITAVLGASGSGKTTLLNMVAGLTDYDGEISGAGKTAYIFQQSRLIRHLTALENLVYVGAKRDMAEILLEKAGVASGLYPKEMSGGMADRVSMCRAFSVKSDTLLMDEPFRGLDVGTKTKMMELFMRLYEEEKPAVLFVTHSPYEAVSLASRAVIVGGGGIVADFFGKNLTEQNLVSVLKSL